MNRDLWYTINPIEPTSAQAILNISGAILWARCRLLGGKFLIESFHNGGFEPSNSGLYSKTMSTYPKLSLGLAQASISVGNC